MAKIERDESGDDFFNVQEVVGYQPAVNYTNDIIVVKALLKYINEGFKWWADSKLPIPNGTKGNLGQIISEYQGKVRKQYKGKIWVAQDGRVSPSIGGKQFFQPGGRYTIMQLNFDAGMVSAALGHGHYIDEIIKRWKVVGYALSSSTKELAFP